MTERSAWTAYAVESALLVLDAGRDLQVALGDLAQRDFAADRLAIIAESRVGGLDELRPQGFEALASPVQAERTEAVESGLDAVLSQLGMANVLLAAGRAVGEEDEPAEAGALTPALGALKKTADVLRQHDEDGTSPRQGFGPSGDAPAASTAELQDRVRRILDLLSMRSAQVATKSFAAIPGLTPKPVQELWEQIGTHLKPGRIVARFLRLGLRAFEAALDVLGRLVPAASLASVRDQVHDLSDRLASDEPAPAVMRWVIGADRVRQEADQVLAADGLDGARLGQTASTLDALSVRFGKVMDVADGIAIAIGLLASALAFFPIAVAAAHIPMAVAGAYLLLVAVVVLIAMDYADSHAGLGLVDGVRVIVLRLAEVTP
ncbi:hypothetical protein [Streptomyces violaceus]|uniref:Integral membrane protein n=1 Tax=Streptomyces violaceus TaxID=1936 RepID=A0ABZ1NLK3_STRVL